MGPLYKHFSVAGLLVTAGLLFPVVSTAQAPKKGSGNLQYKGFVRIIDGNTFEIYPQGNQLGVGAIGIKAPEGNTDCGKLAAQVPKALVQYSIALEEDPNITFDKRNRRMYYVLTSDGRSLARELVKAGLASPDGTGKEATVLRALSLQSAAAGLGCANGKPTEATVAQVASLTKASGGFSLDARASLAPLALPADSPTTAPGFTRVTVASGFVFPTNFAFLPDGRILVAEKKGIVKIIKNGTVLTTPVLDITNEVNDYWDRGLIGMAVDANFASNGYIYLSYTYENDAVDYSGTKTGRVSRFTMSGDTASRASETVILGTSVGASCENFPVGTDCLPSDGPTHSVGGIRVDSAGNLFLTAGDGASFNVISPIDFRAQSLDALGGKMLHVTTSGQGLPTNPYWNGTATANRSKVWSLGLRNPYRFGLKPGSDIPFLGDVGWSTWEEVNVASAAANLGWPCYEGNDQQPGYAPDPICQNLYAQGPSARKLPLFTYEHNGASSAVTGGVFNTGSNYPAQFQGAFFFGDYAQSWIRYLKVDASDNLVSGPTDFMFNADGPVAFNMGPDGNLYYASINTGEIRKITYTGGTPPPLTVTNLSPASGATNVPVSALVQATFSTLLDPASVNSSTFTLKQQTTAVAGTVSYNGAGPTATFTPTASLQPGLTYTATIKGGANGVKDGSGNTLASDVTWSFTVVTVAPPPNGTSYVSDLNPTSASNAWGPIEKDTSNGENAAGDGRPITIRGTVYAKGIGVHAAASITYNLGGGCSLFTSKMGVDDEASSGPSTVTFQVWGDGVKLFDSGILTGTSAVASASVNLSGKHQLQLVVTDGGDGVASDHADWADAKISCGGPSGPIVTSSSPANGATGVALTKTVTATFSTGMDQTSITPASFTLVKQGTTTALPATVSYNTTNFTASLQTSAALLPSTIYVATVKGGSGGVKNTGGTPMAADQSWTFTTTSGQGYISDLTWTSMTNGWGPAELDRSNGENGAGDGRPLSIRGSSFAKGVGVHAPSDIRYSMGGSCSSFSAVVGVDDEVPTGGGSVTFQVWADGVKLYESALLTGTSAGLPINVNVTGKNELQLVVTDGADGPTYDHGDWADAKLNCRSSDAPVPTITSPSSSLLWKVGDVINYAGSAVDGSGAAIPAANLSWNVLLHHCTGLSCHTHPFTSSTGATGSFVAPDHADSTYFELALTAVDSSGRSSTTSLTLQPVLVNLTLASSPSGLQVIYNGEPYTTPATVATIVGSAHTINATSPQGSAVFSSWSDGGAQQHNIVAPANPVTFTAYFGPRISSVSASGITATGATVTWTTDQPTDSQVEYGTTAAYGSATALNTTLVTSHSVTLSGLTAATLYHYRVKSKNASGQLATSGDFTFTTSGGGGVPNGINYLSDLTWTSMTNGYGPAERDRSNGELAGGDGGALSIRGQVFAKGLGTHAASDIRYNLAGSCSVFSAVIGIDDEVVGGSVVFQVWGDGTKRYDSGILTRASAAVNASVSVLGVSQLQLVVTDGGDGVNSDHADWANATVNCTAGPAVTSTTPAAGATGVSLTTAVKATFAAAVNPTTLTTSTVTLVKQGSATLIPASVTWDGATRTVTLQPSSALLNGTVYTATVKGGATGVKDTSGNQMAADQIWSFTTVTNTPQGTPYLSDLTWTSMSNGWGPVERDGSNGENGAGDGLPMSIRGITYAKGLGAHAASDVRYYLGGACSSFTAVVGVDDEVAAGFGSVIFQVWGDGTKLYESGLLTRASAGLSINVGIAGKNQLQLVITDGGDGNSSDHADWANARIICSSVPVVTNTTPASGAAGVPVGTAVTATFASAVNASTVNTTTFTLVRQGTTTVLPATVTYNATNRVATLQPASALLSGTTYTATMKGGVNGVKDTGGNAMASDFTWSFTTLTSAPATTSYLSDLNWISMSNGYGPVEKNSSNGGGGTADGAPITIRGTAYTKGLGAHAASNISYSLGGACSAFTAVVGVDDEVPAGLGSVIFQVWADGSKIYDSGLVIRSSPPVNVNVPVAGKSVLELVITDGGDGNGYDHADWANAKVTCP